MDFQGRAFYNLLRFNSIEEPAIKHYEKWQIEDYRSLSDEQLFKRLNALSVNLDLESFHEISKSFDSPEALVQYLTPDDFEAEKIDKTYLCIFELWRRYKKDCRSLSVFCDELDHWMQAYDGQKEDIDDIIHSYLFELENFLDEEADKGLEPKMVFAIISSYFAHDIENFIYDFIYDLVEKESMTAASELIDAFAVYAQRSIWFEFLKLKMFSRQDIEQFPSLIHRFTEKVLEIKDFELLVELLDLMIDVSLVDLFFSTFKEATKLITTVGQAQELLLILKELYESIEDHKKVKMIEILSASHMKKDALKKITKDDVLIKELSQLAF